MSNLHQQVSLMDLRRLKHFEAIYRLRSFARAADEVGLTQSALSRSLKKLEEELDTVLFDRNTHFVQPTDHAERLIRHTQDVVAAMVVLKDDAVTLKRPVSGVVRVGSGPYPMQPLVTDTIAAFAGQLPGVRVVVTAGDADTLLQGLVDRELDLVVCDISKFDSSALAQDIGVWRLPPEPLAVVCAADHPAATSERLDTAQHPWALPPPSPASHGRFAKALQARLRAGTFPDYQLDSTQACLNLARSGVCITVVPLSLAIEACADGRLAHRLLPASSETNDGVHYLQRRTLNTASKTFMDLLRQTAKTLAARHRPTVT
jgi:LysR family transcriptional regulator of abg operon